MSAERKGVLLNFTPRRLAQLDEVAAVAHRNRTDYIQALIRADVIHYRVEQALAASPELFVIRGGMLAWVAASREGRFRVEEIPSDAPRIAVPGAEDVAISSGLATAFPSHRRFAYVPMQGEAAPPEHRRDALFEEAVLMIQARQVHDTATEGE